MPYSQNRAKKGIDWPTILLCLALIAFGIMNVYSVEPDKGIRQLVFFGIGFIAVLALLTVASSISNIFEVYSPLFYIGSLLLLIGVLIFGREINGAKAWFNLGPVSFQPVEVSKLATGLFLAKYISSTSIDIKSRRTILTSFGIIGVPIVLILLQPDLGSVLVFSAFIIALYREGFSAWYIFIPLLCGTMFLLSITYPPLYITLGIGFITLIICLFITAFSYNRELLRTVMGVFAGLIVFFLTLILIGYFSPEYANLQDLTAKHYENPNILSFNILFYSMIGILISLISIISIYYFLAKDDPDSARKLINPNVGVNQAFEVGLISSVIFLMVSAFSITSDRIYEKLPTHQRERIMVLFEGEGKYRDTSGYNLLYSKTAIGSGDLLGKGYLQGTVKIGKFVPEQSTDYIFCTVGEEWGFIGSTLLVIFYCVFILRVYFLAEQQKSVFSRFFGYSVASIFFIHFFINIAMVMGLFPTVGIPLPFFSYGGSSLISFMTLVTIFLILNYKDKQTLI